MNSAFACDWCVKPEKVFALTEKQIDTTKVVVASEKKDTEVLYFKQYLGRYYPHAKRMCSTLFLSMCPYALYHALEELAALADKTLWLYFLNDKQGFDVRYLDKIIHEFIRINTFIDQAFYNKKTKKMVEIDVKKGNKGVDQRSLLRLTTLWARSKKMVPFRFYAVFYDYLTVKFNATIMCSLQINNFSGMHFTMPLMERMIHKLSGSEYEKYYQDAFEKSKRMANLVTTKFEEQQKRTSRPEVVHHAKI